MEGRRTQLARVRVKRLEMMERELMGLDVSNNVQLYKRVRPCIGVICFPRLRFYAVVTTHTIRLWD
jgi:hypothetical protein